MSKFEFEARSDVRQGKIFFLCKVLTDLWPSILNGHWRDRNRWREKINLISHCADTEMKGWKF